LLKIEDFEPKYMQATLKQKRKSRRIFLMISGRVNLTKQKGGTHYWVFDNLNSYLK